MLTGGNPEVAPEDPSSQLGPKTQVNSNTHTHTKPMSVKKHGDSNVTKHVMIIICSRKGSIAGEGEREREYKKKRERVIESRGHSGVYGLYMETGLVTRAALHSFVT